MGGLDLDGRNMEGRKRMEVGEEGVKMKIERTRGRGTGTEEIEEQKET